MKSESLAERTVWKHEDQVFWSPVGVDSTVIQHFLTFITLILCFLISFYSILFTADLFITWISDKKKTLSMLN